MGTGMDMDTGMATDMAMCKTKEGARWLRKIAFNPNNHLPTHSSRYSSLKKGGEISLDHVFPLLIFLGGVPKAGWLII